MKLRRTIRLIHSCAIALALAMAALPATAQTPTASLAGWWISIDETGVKPLWESGVIVPMEDLLIDGQGRFENRMMGFFSVDREFCSTGGVCSDAPLVATGRLMFSGTGPTATLTIEDFRASTVRIDAARTDRMVRAAAVSSQRTWPVAKIDPADGVLVLRKGTGHETRTFFRIDPDRLRRLRAGLMVAGLSASQHWRCYIAAATGAALPSPGFRATASETPPVGDYIKLASFLQTSAEQGTRPLGDDPDPARRKLAGIAVEELMTERFDALPMPKTPQEQRAAMARVKYLTLVGGGQTATAARAALERDFPNLDVFKQFSRAELAAFALLQSDAPEAKRAFCKP